MPRIASESPFVPVRTLAPGSRFERRNGGTGTLIRLGLGSALVEVEIDDERTFVPVTGPNAGKEVRIKKSRERITWSLEAPVRPIH